MAFAKPYDSQDPAGRGRFVNDHVIAFFDEHGVTLNPHSDRSRH
jgi:hypothetical protein